MVKIMLIEDDKSMIVLLSTLLQMEGYQVSKVNDDSLEQVLESIGKEAPELVLLDVHLHKFSGFDLVTQLRKTSTLAGVKVLMMSGLDMKEECQQKGADDFILKPYMPDDLILKIHQILSPA
jgi:DNA-binding response OmpR family regulator